MEDYRDKIIERLIKINEEQIQVNAKFADVTEKNNSENQKTFKLLNYKWIIIFSILYSLSTFQEKIRHFKKSAFDILRIRHFKKYSLQVGPIVKIR